MDRLSFVFYTEWRDAIKDLAPDVRLEVYEAIIEYAASGAMPARLSQMAALALNFVARDIDRCGEKYAQTSARKRSAAQKRWRADQCADARQESADAQSADNQGGADVQMQSDAEACRTMQSDASACRAMQNDAEVCYKDNDNDNDKDNKETANAVKKARAAPLEDRAKEFYESLVPFVGKYGKETLRDFYEYWSEPTQDKKKMRWELQRTWSVSRRLRTWREKEREINNRNRYEASRGNTQAAAEQRADEAAAIVARLAAENSYD